MPVTVEAELSRRGVVFLAGETVDCQITVSNQSSDVESVQIHCQEVLNRQKILPPPSSKRHVGVNVGGGGTSFVPGRGENGLAVYSSRPVILFCDLEIKPGDSLVYNYSETLPSDDIPPSFKGHAVKYLYKLTVGVQHLNSHVKLLRLPFRVLLLSGLSHVCIDDNGLSPSNPFLRSEYNKATILEIATQVIENITSIKNCHVYNVTTGKGKVGQFTLFKNCFKLGEDVCGMFSFEDSEVNCVQYCVSIQTEEEIAEEFRHKVEQRPTLTTIAKQHAVSLCYKHSQVKLQIPFTATPTFFTDIVHLKWRLHFEFVTSTSILPSCPYYPSDDSLSWTAPSEIDIETMVWDLPIKVYPSNSINACLGAHDGQHADQITL